VEETEVPGDNAKMKIEVV